VLVQYGNWLKNLTLHGDFGPSITATNDIGEDLASAVARDHPPGALRDVLALVLAVISGVVSATRQYSWLDYVFTFFGFLFLAMPAFWTAVLLKQGALTVNEATGDRTFFTIGARSTRRRPASGTRSPTSSGT
jgi:peptide/nickel transport system permease protein